MLAKASHLKSLGDTIKHAEAFEVVQRHHTHIQQLPEVQAFRSSSSYQKQNVTPNKPLNTCSGCGSTTNGWTGANDRSTK